MSTERFTDGFDLNLQLPNCNPWIAFAQHQMEALRKATRYEFFTFVAPEQVTESIPAFGTFSTQLRVPIGSWIWAVTFQAGTDISVIGYAAFLPAFARITEHGTGLMLSNNFSMNSPGAGMTNTLIHSTQTLLTEPRVVIAPGIVNVEISNPNSVPIFAQLVLWCAVPDEARVYQFTECPRPVGPPDEAGGYQQ